jgi:hypothetical protein
MTPPFESPFAYETPPNLIGPDSSGGFYGSVIDVPADGTWEVQVQTGGTWIPVPPRPHEFADPKWWVRARPISPEPLPVGTEVIVHGSYVATILGVDGLWYWVRRSDVPSGYSTVPHRDVRLQTPEES